MSPVAALFMFVMNIVIIICGVYVIDYFGRKQIQRLREQKLALDLKRRSRQDNNQD